MMKLFIDHKNCFEAMIDEPGKILAGSQKRIFHNLPVDSYIMSH
jgi:hypothetical protein